MQKIKTVSFLKAIHFSRIMDFLPGPAVLPMYFLNLLFFPMRQRTWAQRTLQNAEVSLRKAGLEEICGSLLIPSDLCDGHGSHNSDLTPSGARGPGGAGGSWLSALSLSAMATLGRVDFGNSWVRQLVWEAALQTDELFSQILHKQVRALGCTSSPCSYLFWKAGLETIPRAATQTEPSNSLSLLCFLVPYSTEVLSSRHSALSHSNIYN